MGNPFSWLYNVIFGGEEELKYPIPFALVVLSPEASKKGVKDDQNKLIIEYGYNTFGRVAARTYPYTEQRMHALEKIKKVPVFDKTQGEDRFPVFTKVLPQEVQYTTNG